MLKITFLGSEKLPDSRIVYSSKVWTEAYEGKVTLYYCVAVDGRDMVHRCPFTSNITIEIR